MRDGDFETIADPDFIAIRSAKHLAESFRLDSVNGPQNFAVQRLLEMDDISIDIDPHLLKALEKATCANLQMQKHRGACEGELLYILAKLGTDREQAGKLVLSRMGWPLGQSCYSDRHFQAMRICAEQCGSLLPALVAAYQADIKREHVLARISSLALHHDDAWEFFAAYLQDEITSSNARRQMATAFADTWLLAPEETRLRSLERIDRLQAAVGWLDWPSAWGDSNDRLLANNRDPSDKRKQEDVMALFRTQLDESRSAHKVSAAPVPR